MITHVIGPKTIFPLATLDSNTDGTARKWYVEVPFAGATKTLTLGLFVLAVSGSGVRLNINAYQGMDGVRWESTPFWSAFTDVSAETYKLVQSTDDFGPRVRIEIAVSVSGASAQESVTLELQASGKPF